MEQKNQGTLPIIHQYLGVKAVGGVKQSRHEFMRFKGVPVKNEDDQPGYQVHYPDGYISWSPKAAFEDAYRRIEGGHMNFGLAIEALKLGMCVARKGWQGKDLFVFKQVPAVIGEEIIPNMQSVPAGMKKIIMERAHPVLSYTNQMAIVHSDGRVDSWVASSSDTFADDWYIVK